MSLLITPFAAFTVKVTSSFVEFVSGFATGASFTAFTEISKVLVTVVVPSDNVYVTCGTFPLKFVAGEYV